MKSSRGHSKTGRGKKSDTNPSALERKAVAVRRQQKQEAVTAAMEQSQRRGAAGMKPQISDALMRTVEAAKRQRKKQLVTKDMEASQRQGKATAEESSELLRAVKAVGRAQKKAAVTAAMKESQRR